MSVEIEIEMKSVYHLQKARLMLILICGCLYGGTVILGLATSGYDVSIADEGFLLESISRIDAGQVPFRDFYCSYFPGRYYPGLLAYKASGGSLHLFRQFHVFLWGLLPVAAFLIVRRGASLWVSFLAVLPLIVIPGPWYNRWYTAGVLASLLILIRMLERPSLLRVSSAGLCVGIVIWVRQDVGFSAAVIGFFLLLLQSLLFSSSESRMHVFRRLLVFSFSVVVPLLPLLWCIVADPAFRSGFETSMEFALTAYHSRWQVPYPPVYAFIAEGLMSSADWWELVRRLMFHLPVLVLFIHCLVLMRKARPDRYREMIQIHGSPWILLNMLLILWQVTAIYYVSLRSVFSHLLVSASPTWIALGVLFEMVRLPTSSERVLVPALPRLFRYGFMATVLFLVVGLVLFSFLAGDFFTGSPGVLFQTWPEATHGRVDVRMNEGLAWQIREVDRIVRSRTSPDEPFMALPCLSLFGYACERMNPSYFIWVTPDVIRAGVQEQVIREIDHRRVPLLLYADLEIDGDPSRRFSHSARKLNSYVQRHYLSFYHLEAEGWSGGVFLLEREAGSMIRDLTDLTPVKGLQPISVIGSTQVRRLDLGRGLHPYLLMHSPASISFHLQLPSSGELRFTTFRPETITSGQSESLHSCSNCLPQLFMSSRRNIDFPNVSDEKQHIALIQRGDSLVADVTPWAGETSLLQIVCPGNSSCMEQGSLRWCAYGIPRILALSSDFRTEEASQGTDTP